MINKNKIYFIFSIALMVIIMICFENSNIDFYEARASIVILGVLGLINFLIIILLQILSETEKLSKIILCLFYFSFFIFQFGQYVIFAFGIEYDYFFLNYCVPLFGGDYSHIIYSEAFTIASMDLLFIGVNRGKDLLRIKVTENEVKYKRKKLFNVGFILFCISLIPTIILRSRQAEVASSMGYEGIYAMEEMNSIFKLEIFFIPSLAIMMVSCGKGKIAFYVLGIVYSLVCFFIGGRTVAMSSIIILSLLFFPIEKVRKKHVIPLIIVGYFLMCFASFIAIFRGETEKNLSQMFSLFFDSLKPEYLFKFFGELGFSSSSLPMVMQQNEGFLIGKSYIGGVISVIPSSFDFLGIVKFFEKYTLLDEWLTHTTNLSYGSGFSLVAEAYYNFSTFGIIVFFFLGRIINKLVKPYTIKKNGWQKYIAVVSLYFLFTFPRRFFLYFVDSNFFYIIIPYLLYRFTYRINFIYSPNKDGLEKVL